MTRDPWQSVDPEAETQPLPPLPSRPTSEAHVPCRLVSQAYLTAVFVSGTIVGGAVSLAVTILTLGA